MELGSIHFRNVNLAAYAMARRSLNVGANEIEELLFNSDSEPKIHVGCL
jgi:hypothetical protein